jgi:hypothetical protein
MASRLRMAGEIRDWLADLRGSDPPAALLVGQVRTLASYVEALGGRLEITADLGDERIRLR